ncbi:MAG: isopentenyl-diphosphate Delta-isomerase [Longimicrobiales bacterium]|nr:isopentenyl-diphosphate Delta-isomerase [Longimicrobiales bacterium]
MSDRSERVILVDDHDTAVGTADKLEAHRTGALHRAFSVFVQNRRGEMLLQRRARDKYHSGGLWSNACCSHPRPGEPTDAAARHRLREEMGFTCPVDRVAALTYRAEVGGGLVEHEYDHLFVARWDGVPSPDPTEVEDWRWIALAELRAELDRTPERFTYWFRVAFRQLDAAGHLTDPVGRVA